MSPSVTDRTPRPARSPHPGDLVKARIVAADDSCVWLRSEAPALAITVRRDDVQWHRMVDPRAYGRIGELHDVKLLRVAKDSQSASGWLPWPRWYVEQAGRAWRGSWQPGAESLAG